MAKPGAVTHLFAELSSLDDLNSLLGRSARLKYTCLSVCRKFLALGSNSGGVYIFSRDTLKYLQVVFGDTEASLVVSVSLSPSDQHVAIALSTGHVAVFELNIDRRIKPDRVRYTQDHAGNTVTALAWDAASARVFVGDNAGKISTIFIPNKGKSLFASPSEVIAYVESSVYQMEWWKDKLLVSTLTHTHLFDTVRQNYCTIGTKSRQGEYGSCFYMEPNSKATVIYCARPGSRMWEVDSEGKVLNTHQLKQLLGVAPTPVVRLGSEQFEFSNTPQAGHSVNFCKMFHISQFIITWSSKGLYLFDPINVKVMIWTQSFQGIKDMSVYNNDIYLFLEGSSIHRVTLLPVYQLFIVLCNRGLWSLSSSLLLAADQVGVRLAVMKRIKRDLLQDILAGLKNQGKESTVEKVKAFMEDISEGSVESVEALNDLMDSIEVKGHTYLPSGMVIVSEGVGITQPWEKKSLEKLNYLEDDDSNLQTKSSVTPDNVELQKNNSFVGCYSDNELPKEAEQKDDCQNEQRKNSDFINLNQDKSEENRTSPSGSVQEWVVTDQFFGRDVECDDSRNAQDENWNLCRNSGPELGNSLLQLENGLLPVAGSDLAQEINKESTSEVSDNHSLSDNHNLLLCDRTNNDVKIDGSLENHNNYSDVELVLARKMPAGDSVADESFCKSAFVDDNVTKPQDFLSVDSVFVENSGEDVASIEETSNCDIAVNSVSQRKLSSSSECFLGISESKTSPKEGSHGHFFSESDKILSRLQSSTQEGDIADSYLIDNVPCISDEIAPGSSQHHKDAAEDQISRSTDFDNHENDEVKLLLTTQDMVLSDKDIELSQPKLEQLRAVKPALQHLHIHLDHPDNVVSDLSKGDMTSTDRSYPATKFPSLNLLSSDSSEIAQPVKVSKKKRKKKGEDILRSHSLDVTAAKSNKGEVLRTTVSVGDDFEDQFAQGLDLEMDSISIATISSIEEESGLFGSPDSASTLGDSEVAEPAADHKFSPELPSLIPSDLPGKLPPRKSSFQGEKQREIIPPLIDRLNAAHRSASSDDMLAGLHQDSLSASPLSVSGEHFLSVGSPRASLSAFKDGLSLKLKTQTKSFIKTFKEKNPLAKSSNSAAPPVASPPQQERSTEDYISSQAQFTDQLDGLSAEDKLASVKILAASAAKTSALYIFALDIQAQLKSSGAIVRPVALRKMLNDWAVELNSALSRYHEELVKRKAEMQIHEKQLNELENGGNNEHADTSHEVSKEKHPSESSNGVCFDDFSLRTAENNQSVTSNSDLASSESHVTFFQSSSSDVIHSGYPSLTRAYWVDVMHCDDPFHLPSNQLDVFRTLTTMCFVSGTTGNILRHLNFTEEIHLRSFVRAVLPSSVYELFSQDCSGLTSLFPDHHVSSDHSPYQHTERNVSTYVTNGKQDKLPGDLHATAAGSSQKDADINLNHIIQEPENSPFNISVSVNDINNEASPGADDKLKLLCKRNSLSWNENEELKHDISMALFIRQFFFALDYEKVKLALEKQKKRMFISWVSLVLCCREKGRGDIVSSILAEKQISSAIDYLRSGILPNQSALLGHIYSLFEMAPMKTSEFCGEIWETVKPVDVIQFCCLCSKPPAAYLLRYFRQAMISLPTTARPAAFSQLCGNRDVRYLLMQTILSPGSKDVSTDGISSLVTQLKAVLPFDWLNSLLSLIASDDERERIVQLCAKNGYPAVCVRLLSEVNQWQKLLQLILDLNDITLLTGAHGEDGYIPKNEEEWKFLLRCFSDKWSGHNSAPASAETVVQTRDGKPEEQIPLHSPDSSLPVFSILVVEDSRVITEDSTPATEQLNPSSVKEAESSKTEDGLSLGYESFSTARSYDAGAQHKAITWNSLGCLLLKHVGGAAAIDLLMQHLHDPKNCLSAGFLKACYLDFVVKMEQNRVTHEILEKMSVYMWKKKPDYVPPPVFHAIKTEKLIKKGEGDDDTVQALFSQVKALNGRDLMSENLGSQWGHEVTISSQCLCCHLPLKSVVSVTLQGVVIFPCGHAFHKCCASDTVCPLIH